MIQNPPDIDWKATLDDMQGRLGRLEIVVASCVAQQIAEHEFDVEHDDVLKGAVESLRADVGRMLQVMAQPKSRLSG